ncbi:MAG: hypothetical protein LBE33_05370 [Zoogloeaceae bacterium]|jgi:hydrogenase-1 operon protein HyaE|nr:hypothetical protein [Zoogloeaceae bacterium]
MPTISMNQDDLRSDFLKLGYHEVDAEGLDAWAAGHEHAVMLPLENPARYPELADIAVILPEILRQFASGAFAVAFGSPQSTAALSERFAVHRHPALIFFRRGQYIGTLTGLHDWTGYLREFARLREQALQAAAQATNAEADAAQELYS